MLVQNFMVLIQLCTISIISLITLNALPEKIIEEIKLIKESDHLWSKPKQWMMCALQYNTSQLSDHINH